MNLWYMKLEYLEIEGQYGLLLAGSSDNHQKSFREAIRLSATSDAEDVVGKLRELADKIERRIT